MLVKPGSQHAKFLPIIRKTILDADPKKIWADFRLCADGTRLPKFEDILVEGASTEKKIGGHEVTVTKLKTAEDAWLYELLRRMDGFKEGFAPAEKMITKILDENTPTFELRIAKVQIVFSGFEQAIPDKLKGAWGKIAARLEDALWKRGYRMEDVSSPFEHALKNDAWGGYGPIFKDGRINFSLQHVPLPILKMRMGVEETATSRELEVLCGAHPKHYGMEWNGKMMTVSYEPLARDGKTMWLPVAINSADLGEALKKWPIPVAFRECETAGARLNVEEVIAYVKSSFGLRA